MSRALTGGVSTTEPQRSPSTILNYLFPFFGCTGSSLLGLSLVVASGCCSALLLIAVTSLVAEHRLEEHRLQ